MAINAAGGAENYVYSWNTPEAQNVSRLENLGSGEYVVTVTDEVGCTATVSQTITAPSAALALSFDGDDQVCEGSQASVRNKNNRYVRFLSVFSPERDQPAGIPDDD